MNNKDKKVLIDYHDDVIGHVLLTEKDGKLSLCVGNRDLEFKDGERIAGGMFVAGTAVYPDCRKCLLGDDKSDACYEADSQ